MIGNDIVDRSIAHAGKGSRRQRWLQKVCTPHEILQLKAAPDQDLALWLLWSIKESVYKIIARQEGRVRYAPKTISCQSVAADGPLAYTAAVRYGTQQYTAESTVSEQYIYTVARVGSVDRSAMYTATVYPYRDSAHTGSLDGYVVRALSALDGCRGSEVVIQRDHIGIPRVYIDGAESGVLSLTHHGRYAGYCYLPQG